MNEPLLAQLNRVQRISLAIGGVALVVCALGAALETHQFFVSYLCAYTFWLGLSLGCLGVAMMHHLTGGRWGFATRRFFEAGFMTLPLMALLFIPLLFGLRELYPWARPAEVAASEILQQKQAYLNVPGFVGRAVLFFAVWIALALLLRKWSLAQDTTAETRPTVRLRALSGPGIVIYPLTGTFAFVDWIMSIEPKWYSSIFPVIVLIGQVLSAFAFVILLLAWCREREPFGAVVTSTHFHHLGNLLLAFVIFWTYVSFGQLLIIYSGNLPHEIEWYLRRIEGSWRWLIVFLVVFHFVVPFFLLLFRGTKRSASRLAAIAALVLGVHVVAVFWVIAPAFHHHGIRVHWLDFAAVLGVGGIWMALFVINLKSKALLPRNDPRIEYSLPSSLANAK